MMRFGWKKSRRQPEQPVETAEAVLERWLPMLGVRRGDMICDSIEVHFDKYGVPVPRVKWRTAWRDPSPVCTPQGLAP